MSELNRSKVKIVSRDEDYAQWYLDVAQTGELFEYSPTPGCITFLPKAVDMWEKIKSFVDYQFKLKGVRNIYLPLLIPMSFLEKEKDHVEGFAPELAVVSHGGGKALKQKLTVRPTSETLFCDFFKKNLQSYKDLPLLYNQWVNVMRWEKRTRPFLRTTEFYWQEGHTIHETIEEASEFSLGILNDVYIKFLREVCAIDGIAGEKSESERFAGADHTFTFEPMMSNGWALQICTSHVLSQEFMKSFDVKFLDKEGKLGYPAYTSWGLSTRTIGGIISSHSDDRGLIIPPRLSEYKVMILPIYGKDNETEVNKYIAKIGEILTGSKEPIKVKGEQFMSFYGEKGKVLVDFRNERLGRKINDFEISGYPIRIECGARDIENSACVIAPRIGGEKEIIKLDELTDKIEELSDNIQNILFENSAQRLRENIVACETLDELGDAMESGKFAIMEWDQDPKWEEEIKEKFKATTRCLPFEGQFTDDLLKLKDDKNVKVIIARAF